MILLSYCLLALQPDLRLAVPELIGSTAVIAALLALVLFFGERQRLDWSPRMILTIAAATRLLFLFRSPELSDDIYRYLWDGLTLLLGNNPYTAAPSLVQPATEHLAALQQLVNHSGLVTIYPPAAQLVFAAGALLGGSILGLKLLLILLDLGSCMLIMRLLRAFRQPSWKAVLYAWQPLPVLEVAASGHIDTAGICFFLVTLCLIIDTNSSTLAMDPTASPVQSETRHKCSLRTFLAGGTFACAVLVKLLPLIFLPGVLLILRRCRLPFLLGAACGGAASLLPFLPDLVNAGETLRTYAVHWEFAGFAFRSLRQASGSGESARIILAALFLATAGYCYAQSALELKRSALSLESQAPLGALQACSEVTFLYLILTPTLHPWYALYLVVFLPFTAGAARLVLSWSVFLGYQVLLPYTILGQWVEDDVTAALVSLVPIAAFLAVTLIRSRELQPQ